jgi:hypothetical protein
MKVQRIYNAELVGNILALPEVQEKLVEDNEPLGPDFVPDLDNAVVIAMLSHDNVHGIVIGRLLSANVLEATFALVPEFVGSKDNVPLARGAITELFEHSIARKITSTIPTADTETLRFMQRVGFKREGVSKASFLRNGTMIDQYYVGLTRD